MRTQPGAFSGRPCGADRRPVPQDFLRKEFSEENILFWQACEGFNHVPAHDKKEVRPLAGGAGVPGGRHESGFAGCGARCVSRMFPNAMLGFA